MLNYTTNIPNNYKRSAIVIGNFDGIHRGHQKVFKKTKKFASKNKIKFGVLTFTPLPIMFFNKKIKNFRLISEDIKLTLFKKYGVDFIINIRFDKNFSEINAKKMNYRRRSRSWDRFEEHVILYLIENVDFIKKYPSVTLTRSFDTT